MTTKTPFDPFAMWKNMYEQTEANWNQPLQDFMEKEAFSEGMGETLNYYLQYQELVNKMTESYLKGMNMPTREEIADVASLVIHLEEKVDQYTDEMDEKFSKLSVSRELGQVRRAITNLEKKLDTVLESVNHDKKEVEKRADK